MTGTSIAVIRHAEAGDRDRWSAPDDLRPLTKGGRLQAQRIAERFGDEPLVQVMSSPFVRCVQTVSPLADALGLPVLLRAWPLLRGSGIRLRVLGADPLAVRLLLARLRLPEEGIDILGFVEDETLTEELAAAKLLVAPSLGNESFGMTITRAFACATPVVASDIPGYREVVTEETGALVPPGDADALAETIAALLADEPARIERGRAARERAMSEYAWPLCARRLAKCYERVLEG